MLFPTYTFAAFLAIIVVGTLLHINGQATIGEMVTFMNFAGLIIARLEQSVNFINHVMSEAPRLREFFQVWDTVPAIRDREFAVDPGRLVGRVEFTDVMVKSVSGAAHYQAVSASDCRLRVRC